MNESLNKFKIYIREINTGELSDITIKAPFNLKHAKSIAKYLIDQQEFEVINVEAVRSIVKIPIEPFCLS